MKTNVILALTCGLALITAACGHDAKKDETPMSGESAVVQEKSADGLFTDEPFVMTSDYYGQNINLSFDGDVTSPGVMRLYGADARALFEAMSVEALPQPDSQSGKIHRKTWRKSGATWWCTKDSHIRGASYACEMGFDYWTGESEIHDFNKTSSPETSPVDRIYKGPSLSLFPAKTDRPLGMIDLTGQDARVLWYSLKTDEKPASLGIGPVDVRQKAAGDFVCWKTPVGELVSFNCRLSLDWSTGQALPVAAE